ncbi:Sulfoquinovosyl transferase SQD2 [Seminavis robusta]|uniref:Sulfoquinovosyl transferase SQD2 n=1 Tax=Seminavis robusta TaxID=568900 RepID=A0A9N8E8Q3_9STRA|nr:Sulfoquinovosyl transferase SQD2 [Seminavis robusta]|eukprot:Sro747_g196520.1 Sulfoquinovosyl transferase SQD2 (470) ;mRNA; f:17570-19267
MTSFSFLIVALLAATKTVDAFSAIAPPQGKNKVLVLVEPSPLTYVSGYANRFQALFKHLDSQQTNFEVVTVDVHSGQKPDSHLGRTVHHTAAVPIPWYNELGLSVDWRFQIGRVIRRMRPDILHVSSPGLLPFPALLYSRLFQIPLLFSYHTHMPIYVRSYVPKFMGLQRGCEWLSWQLIRIFHSMVDATVATSPQIVQEFKDHGIPRCFLWEKGVDTERFHPRFKSQEMRHRITNGNPDDFLIVHVGRLGREKRIDEIKEILHKMDNTRLCIVGHGPYEKQLHKNFAEFGDKVHFTGLLHGDELSQAYASADAFCMPSDSETLGFVVLESMASEVPVVGCNAGGIPHTIRPVENTGSFLVETGDIDGYVEKLKLLQSNVELRQRMGRRSREEMLRWSWEDSMSQLREETYRVAKENKHNRWENRLWRVATLQPLRKRIFGRRRRQQQRTVMGAGDAVPTVVSAKVEDI